jgi:chloramphenicol-sensitive protein RarD
MTTSARGIAFGVAAYGLWGLFPLYWPLLRPASPLEILACRMIFSLLTVTLVVIAARRWATVRRLASRRLAVLLLVVAAALITVNWGTYIWGVNTGQVVETSLGYFINPLVTVLLGVLVLGERLRAAQWTAVGLGFVAVLVLTLGYGSAPWLALTLAFSFGGYGLLKKKANAGALDGLAVETGAQFLPALGYLLLLGAQGRATLATGGAGHALLLAASGLVTAVPLLLFAAATRRVPLSTVGMLQFLAPVLQLLIGVTVDHEPMPPERLIGFGIVWLALLILTWDAVGHTRRVRVLARSTPRTADSLTCAEP